MKQLNTLLSVLALSLSLNICIANEKEHPREKERLTIAVVLAGGGAKGAAHVGVLKRLEELRIPVDIITGTSIGAYIGGLYATGRSAAEVEDILLEQDWNNGYIDRINRSERSLRSKSQGDRYQIHTDIGIKLSSIEVPNGLLQGQSMLTLIRQTTGSISTLASFDELAIPYRAIATNINTMNADVLDSGYLPDVMMASMSIPALLPPFEIDGNKYIDGGVINNIPIQAAKELGADIIIAIDVSSSYKTESELNGMMNIIDQLSIHMVKRSTEQQIGRLTTKDIYLKPNVGHIETTDFAAMEFALNQGYKSTFTVTEKLSNLAISESEYAAYKANKSARKQQLLHNKKIKLDRIIVENHSRYQSSTLINLLDLSEDKYFSNSEIEAAISSLYALDDLELVTYQLAESKAEMHLIMNVKEKSWGPNYLDFRLHIEEDFNANSVYSIGATSHFTHLNKFGGEAYFGIDLGTSKRIDLDFIQPITNTNTFTFGTGIHYLSDKGNVLFAPNSLQASKDESDFIPFSKKSIQGEFEVAMHLQPWQKLTVGYLIENGDTSLSPAPTLGEIDYRRQGAYSSYLVDSLDDIAFPEKGILAEVAVHYYDDNYQLPGQTQTDVATTEFTSKIRFVESVGSHTFDMKMEYGLIDTEDNAIALSPLRLGGFLNLSGVPRDSLVGKEKAFGAFSYRYQWFENDFGLFQSPIYLGASLEKGSVWQDTSLNINDVDLNQSVSVYMGIKSPVGSIIVSASRVNNNSNTFYLSIGSPFP